MPDHAATNGKPTRRAFNPSNEPDTCLYCGSRLYAHPGKEYTLKNTVTLCCQAPVEQRIERDDTLSGWRSVSRCSTCRRELVVDADDTEVRERTEVYGRSDTRGYDGVFCTLDCGYRFGQLAASKGVRYRKSTPEGDPRCTRPTTSP